MHVVSKKDLNSAELETMSTSKKSDDGDDGQRRGANKRRSDSLCQTIGLICDGLCFLKKLRSFCLGETLSGPWVYLLLDWRSKTTSHQKWQEN